MNEIMEHLGGMWIAVVAAVTTLPLVIVMVCDPLKDAILTMMAWVM